jgi:DNA-binding GntR family transcriptional regulator
VESLDEEATTDFGSERYVLSVQVKDRIMQWILEGRLAPGDRVVETQVARELGTSQSPVREALRDLATLGIVEIIPYRGARVREPSKKELVDAVRVRVELEAMAAREAATRTTKACIEKLDTLLSDMIAAAGRSDPHDLALGSVRFHTAIVQAAGNAALERAWSVLEPMSRSYITASLPGVDLELLAVRHRDLIDVLRAGDPDGADGVMRRHLEHAAAAIEELWGDETAGGQA